MPTAPFSPPLPDLDGAVEERPQPRSVGFLVGAIALASAFAVIVVPGVHALRGTVVLPVAALLPGWCLLRILDPPRGSSTSELVPSVAFSLLALMAMGLALHLLPGAALGPHRVTAGFLVLCTALLVTAARRAPAAPRGSLRAVVGRTGAPSALVLAAGLGSVVAAFAGADAVDHGHGPFLSMLAIGLVGATLVTAAWRRAGDRAVVAGLYLASLALLLLVSRRGAAISGHDVKTEYRVFLDTLQAGRWHWGGPFAGYASCLSITVLPTVLQHLLGISPSDVFTVVLQAIFAVVGPGVFVLARRILGRGGSRWTAVAATALFLAFPTFINDLPMLVRQEVALLLFVTAVLAVVEGGRPYRARRSWLLLAGVGMIASHYSTAYVAIAVFVFAAVIAAAVRRWGWRLDHPPFEAHLASPLAVGPLMLLLVAAITWGGITGTVGSAAEGVEAAFGSKTVAGSYQVLRPPRPGEPQQVLADYVRQVRQGNVAALDAHPAASPGPDCQVTVDPPHRMTPTAAGRALGRAGVPPYGLNRFLRSGAVLVFQVGAVAGLLLLWRRQRRGRTAPLEAFAMSAGLLATLLVVVVLPEAAVAYGPLRLYQQALVLLAPFTAAALAAMAGGGRRGGRLAVGVAVAVLLVTSGFAPRITGGYPGQLSLDSGSDYAAAYETTDSALAVLSDARAEVPTTAYLAGDSASSRDIRAFSDRIPLEGLAPGLTPADAYVVARVDDVGIAAVATFGDTIIRYHVRSDCLGDRTTLARHGDAVLLGPAR